MAHARRQARGPDHDCGRAVAQQPKFASRRADVFLGVPFNIASYALLTQMLAQQCALEVGDFVWTGGDCHLYLNHLEQVELQLARQPYGLPQLALLRKPASIFDYQFADFEFRDYQFHPSIKAPVAV